MENTKPLTKSIYKKDIGEYFEYSMDFEFLDVVAEVLERIDFDELNDDNICEMVLDAIGDEVIYYNQQWTIIEHYQTPKDANFDEAMSEFDDDIYNLVVKIMKK